MGRRRPTGAFVVPAHIEYGPEPVGTHQALSAIGEAMRISGPTIIGFGRRFTGDVGPAQDWAGMAALVHADTMTSRPSRALPATAAQALY